MKIAEITVKQLDESVEISGRIVSIRDLTKGCKFVIQDETGKIPLILWANVLEEIAERDQLRAGAEIAARGRVSEYKGELRVVPGRGSDIKLLTPADDQTRPSTPLAQLASVGVGRSVWVTGVITSLELFSKGAKVHITDGTGTAIILLWQNVYDALPDKDSLTLDTRIGVFGEVNRYRDDWEIVPRSKMELIILEKAP